ncbi:MAG TPA: methyltransferase domain-containing protein [Armatimonadota bacterium]|nr:methyltransferase domain-containing protein [Armatimonadota bacterium]
MCSRRVRPIEETEAAWVPEYFGEEYLRLYQFPPSRTDPEVAFLAETLSARLPPRGRVLDLGCGQGRHAIPLARRGFRVIGLDVQANLLDVAARRARDSGVDLPLVRGDMRRLPFADGTVDAVLCLFSAFGYFADEENARVLAEVARVLKVGGWFVLDVANRDALLRHAQPRSWKRLPDGALVISTWRWDVWTGRYTHEQVLVDGDEARRFAHSVRVYTCTELRALLRDAGLAVMDAAGGFRGEALALDAPRLVLIARTAA